MMQSRRSILGAAGLWSAGSLLIHATKGVAAVPQKTLNVIELRQYTLRGGRREALIDLFVREFIAPQNSVGAYVLGAFRDLDDPDRFVWLRGFESMESRREALTAFYGGPVWSAHREAANSTMVDSDNVLLLRPSGSPMHPTPPFLAGVPLVTVDIDYLGAVDPATFAGYYDRVVRPRLRALGAEPSAVLVSETGANTFPRLPVRTDDRVLLALTAWSSHERQQSVAHRSADWSGWRDDAPAAVLPALMRKPERLRLSPIPIEPIA